MIKFFVVEFRDLGFASLVLGMALLAFLALLHPAVVTGLVLDVLANLLVTVHAKPGLRALVEFLVALFAIFFLLGMSLYDVAGHQKLVSLRLHGQRKHEPHQSKNSKES